MLFYHGTSRLMDIHHPSTLFYHRTNSFMDHQKVFLILYIYSLKEICTKVVFDFAFSQFVNLLLPKS